MTTNARLRTYIFPASVAMATVAFLLAVQLSASAAAPLPDGSEDHPAGSQIAKHEGVAATDPPLGGRTVGAVPGIDVSSHQGNVDWASHWNRGVKFAYVKATEGTAYKNASFSQQYTGSHDVGMIRGSYHFALPDRSDGAAQANFFVDNGGGWSPDGKTLPGALDVEYNPYGSSCYGLTAGQMVGWIRSFSDTYHARTGRWPVIYTSTNWWNQCTGSSGDFSSTNPLWIARYSESVGPLPYKWGVHTIWQYASTPIDLNEFNGTYERLVSLTNG